MAILLYQSQIDVMSAKAVASLSLMGAHQHNQYFLDLNTSGEISGRQNSDLDGPQVCNLLDPIHEEDDDMKGMASN
jgi:hypothetical protein